MIHACKTIYGFDPRERKPIGSPRQEIFNQMRIDTVTSFVREFRRRPVESERAGHPHRRVRRYQPDQRGAGCAAAVSPPGPVPGLIEDYFLATYTEEKPDEMPAAVAEARRLAGPDVKLLSALSPFNRFLTSNEQMVDAAKAQLAGDADGLWIYVRITWKSWTCGRARRRPRL
ncbi:MAG: hypothetical protein R3C45_20710 [Phycisphaerales bacterium]